MSRRNEWMRKCSTACKRHSRPGGGVTDDTVARAPRPTLAEVATTISREDCGTASLTVRGSTFAPVTMTVFSSVIASPRFLPDVVSPNMSFIWRLTALSFRRAQGFLPVKLESKRSLPKLRGKKKRFCAQCESTDVQTTKKGRRYQNKIPPSCCVLSSSCGSGHWWWMRRWIAGQFLRKKVSSP